jgi:hypothetical protein
VSVRTVSEAKELYEFGGPIDGDGDYLGVELRLWLSATLPLSALFYEHDCTPLPSRSHSLRKEIWRRLGHLLQKSPLHIYSIRILKS